MSRLTTVNPETAEPVAKTLLEKVRRALGVMPNMMRGMATSPAVLDAYLSFSGALAKGSLTAAVREQIALVAATENSCGYCYAAHNVLGARAGVSAADLATGGRAEAADPRTAAALRFARAVLRKRGFVSDDELAEVHAAGSPTVRSGRSSARWRSTSSPTTSTPSPRPTSTSRSFRYRCMSTPEPIPARVTMR